MDLSPHRTDSAPVDEKLWLGSKHGTDATRTITIDVTNGGFTVVDGGDGYGYIPSGTPVKKHAASGFYRRVVTTGGSEEAADGHLFESVRVKIGTDATTKAGAALLWHGVVIDAKVPGTFVDLNRAAKHILYV